MSYMAITAKFLGPTDTLGARVKATSPQGKSVTVGYHDPSDPYTEAARALAIKMGWSGSWFEGLLTGGDRVFVRVSTVGLPGAAFHVSES